MALILSIDTATEYASLALSEGENIIATSHNKEIRDHASWIHNAMHELLQQNGYAISHLQAIAVSAGPGSYTGLRVGMATAKGLCYVLNIPLITENTLKVMALAAVQQAKPQTSNLKPETLLVPMIDARRMEVFTAVYDQQLKEVKPPLALILEAGSFDEIGPINPMICFGSGSQKFQSIARAGQFEFIEVSFGAGALASLAYEKFGKKEFADLAYTEPLYLKEFYTPAKK